MKWLMMGSLVVLAACAGGDKVEVTRDDGDTRLARGDCFTVVLFDGFEVKPAPEGMPAEHAAYLGEWRFGAWDGEWCHDMIITEITKNGQVSIMDLHAPHEPWGKVATAFKRTGRINDDGKLLFRHGNTTREYEVVGDRLHGRMIDALEGMREVRLHRPEDAPVQTASEEPGTDVAKDTASDAATDPAAKDNAS